MQHNNDYINFKTLQLVLSQAKYEIQGKEAATKVASAFAWFDKLEEKFKPSEPKASGFTSIKETTPNKNKKSLGGDK